LKKYTDSIFRVEEFAKQDTNNQVVGSKLNYTSAAVLIKMLIIPNFGSWDCTVATITKL
jgi:hypothetical protein